MAKRSTQTPDTTEGPAADTSVTTETPATKKSARRLYLVSEQVTGDAVEGTVGKPVALVEASSAAQAVQFHTGAHKFVAVYADQAELFAAAKAGLEVQSAPTKDATA